jgi:hypothetical protein
MCVCSSASLKEGRRQGQIHTVRREAEDTVLRAEGGHRSRTPGWLPANGSDSTRVVKMMPPKSFDKNIAEECCELWLDVPAETRPTIDLGAPLLPHPGSNAFSSGSAN